MRGLLNIPTRHFRPHCVKEKGVRSPDTDGFRPLRRCSRQRIGSPGGCAAWMPGQSRYEVRMGDGCATSSCLALLDAFARLSSFQGGIGLAYLNKDRSLRGAGGDEAIWLGMAIPYENAAPPAGARNDTVGRTGIVRDGVPCPYRTGGHTGSVPLRGRVGMWGIGTRGRLCRSRPGGAAWMPGRGRYDVEGGGLSVEESRIALFEGANGLP